MDALIRGAVLAGGRRSLRRGSAPAPDQAPPAGGVDAAWEARLAAALDEALAEERAALAAERAGLEREYVARRDSLEHSLAQRAEAARAAAAEAGQADGLARGRAAGEAAFAVQLARLQSIASELDVARRAVLDAAQDDLVALAFEAVAAIAGTSARAVVAHAVADSVARLQAGALLTVRVHPDDLPLLAGGWDAGVQLVPDAGLALGGCLVESAHGTLDARLDAQLEQLRGALLRARQAAPPGGAA